MEAQHAQQPTLDAQLGFYQTWKEFAEFSYNTLVYKHLDWPSLTVQWLPGALQPADTPQLASQCLLLGTQTSGQEPNAVLVYDALLQGPDAVLPTGQALAAPDLSVLQEVPHGTLDVNRARAMPQDADLVATCSDSSEVLLFRLSTQAARQRRRQDSSQQAADDTAALGADHMDSPAADGMSVGNGQSDSQHGEMLPDCRLRGGHTEGGFGLAWDAVEAGRLLTGGTDGKACIWSVEEGAADVLGPLQVIDDYGSAVNAVAWSVSNPGMYAVVGESGHLMLRDARAAAQSSPITHSRLHHGSELLCVDLDPCNEHRLAAGNVSGNVAIVDTRRPDTPLHMLKQHAGVINAVAWNPHVGAALATASADGTVVLWDVARVLAGHSSAGANAATAATAEPSTAAQPRNGGKEGAQPVKKASRRPAIKRHSTTDEPLERAPPGLLFCHAGNMGEVADVSWNPDPARPWMLASVSAELIGDTGACVQPHVCMVWEAAQEMMQLW